MTIQKAFLIAPILLLTACGTRKMDVNMGGRKMESLRARAEKTGTVWTVDTELPMGRWKVTLPDDHVDARVVEVDGRLHARFELLHDQRFELRDNNSRQSHPVRLAIQAVRADGEVEGGEYIYELVPRFPAQGFMEFVAFFHFFGVRSTGSAPGR
jgi:hypothetical protein